MKTLKNKIAAITLAAFFMLSMTASTMLVPSVKAHYPAWIVPTYCYAFVANSVIGVGQAELIIFWINAVPPTAQGTYGDRWTFYVDIAKPDGTNETEGPVTSDPVGGGYITYTPSQVGTYTIVARFIEQAVTGLPVNPNPAAGQNLIAVNDTYSASASDPITFTVQQEPIPEWQEPPLPTQYWTLPINEANRGWSGLAGNWLARAAQNVGPTRRFGYGTAPESAHVMWATPMWSGGIMDARFGNIGYETTNYEGLEFTPPIILNGKLYYNVVSLPREGWYCLDLYTGKTEYFYNTTGPVTGVSESGSGSIAVGGLSFGQIYNYESPNQHGGMPYLWSTKGPTPNTWMMFDAYSGNYMCSINNVPSWANYDTFLVRGGDRSVYGKDGSILGYNVVNLGTAAAPNYYLQVWNTSRAIWYKPTYSSNNYWLWRPGLNVTYDGNNGYSLNASIPAVQGSILAVREDQYVIGGTSGKKNDTYTLQGNLWALNLKPDSNGLITPTLLWNITFTPPQQLADSVYGGTYGVVPWAATGPAVDPEDGVFIITNAVLRQRWCYSLETGQLLWGPTAPEPAMNYYGMMSDIYQGKLFTFGMGGVLIAYDIKTGEVLWNYTAAQVGHESPYGTYPLMLSFIADGKLYLYSMEHSPTQPLWRGSYLRCVNASNGVELWKILHFEGAFSPAVTENLGGSVIADGFVVGLNFYDCRIYCYGKGPSATTVSAPDTAVSFGSSITISGTVTDQCAGAQALASKMGYVNGVACVSDASQEAWMEYLYEQQAKPTNPTGVPLAIDAVDPNGNFVHLGDATSDASGFFKLAVDTNMLSAGPGTYTVIASFAGSKSYWPSTSESAFTVNSAAATASPQPIAAQPPTEMYFAISTAAIIAAIAIGFAITILMLRKRP